MTELTAGDGHKLSAYRVDPGETPKGAVVVVQEVFGINPHIRKMADQFAAEGYVAIAPALFDRVKHGVELSYDEAALDEGLGIKQQIEEATALADIQAAVDAVGSAGKVAIVGLLLGRLPRLSPAASPACPARSAITVPASSSCLERSPGFRRSPTGLKRIP